MSLSAARCSLLYILFQIFICRLPVVDDISILSLDSQMPMVKPTVAMDRGIATDDNVNWLRANGYHYIVIKREDGCAEYRQQFEAQRGTFECVSSKKSIYGDVTTQRST